MILRAWTFSSARTKTDAIVNLLLASHSADTALKALEDNRISYCGVATAGIFPVIIQYFDWQNCGVQWKLTEVQNTHNETAETIAQYSKETLEKNGSFEKYVAFVGDNGNTMFRGLRRDEEGKNVFANVKKLLQKGTLISVGSPAHILNNCVHWEHYFLNLQWFS